MSKITNFPGLPPSPAGDGGGKKPEPAAAEPMSLRDLYKAFTQKDAPAEWSERVTEAVLEVHLENHIRDCLRALEQNAPGAWLTSSVILILFALGEGKRLSALLAAVSLLERAKRIKLDEIIGGIQEGKA